MNSMILKSASFATRVPLSSRSHSRDHSHTCRAQELQGRVVSTSANNTTIVAVENVSVHPLYSKRVKRTVRHTCHDDKGEAEVGDLVTLVPTRPLSKTKRFIVDEILLKGN